MLSTNGKNPLVAATYYFNPGGSLLRTSSGNGGQTGLDSGHFEPSQSLEGRSSKVTKRGDRGVALEDEAGSCSSADGRKGSCYEAKECVSRGGTPMGSCNPSDSGSVCCICKCVCITQLVSFLSDQRPFNGIKMVVKHSFLLLTSFSLSLSIGTFFLLTANKT